MRHTLAILAMLICSAAFGQITVPTEVEPYTLVPALIDMDLPEGSYLADGGWEVIPENLDNAADMHAVDKEMVFVGPPGRYTVIYDGVILQDVSVPDGNGGTITIRNYMGRIKGRAVCTIKGEEVNPTPPPTPEGQWAVIVEETEEMTPQRGNLWVTLRTKYTLSKLLIVDQDSKAASLEPYLKAVRDSQLPLPVLVVVSVDGSVVRAVSCPTTVAGVTEEISK